jgi:ribonuclease HI
MNQELKTCTDVKQVLVTGHRGTEGNETAYQLAKIGS